MEAVIVITGADNGIGFHMARALLEDGYRLAALDLYDCNLLSLANDYPEQLSIFRCDVTDPAQVDSAVASVVKRWGRIDVLVNNACLALFETFETKSLADTRQEFEVNYYGYIHTIAAVLPQMKAQGEGIIHNVSSGVGVTGFPGIYGYASTKGAIESLTRTLALEFAEYGIEVKLMHPPLTNTQSASPLGIPAQVMDDPAEVGRKLAKKIFSTKPVIAPDLRTSIYLFFAYRYPLALGKLFANLTRRATSSES